MCQLSRFLAGLCAVVLATIPAHVRAASNVVVYDEALGGSWDNWSWGTQDLANTSPVHSGSYSIRKLVTNYEGLYLHYYGSLDSSSYTNFSFWIHGGTSGGQYQNLKLQLNGSLVYSVPVPPPVANTWTKQNISLASLPAGSFNEIIFQATYATNAGNVYFDDLVLEAGPPPPAGVVGITVAVDTLKNRHAISPLIYGVAFAGSNDLKELNAPLNRWGGNATTRYNWYLNTANRAADWFFINVPYDSASPGQEADTFVQQSVNGGAQPMLTIPMIEWMPKTRAKTWSYSVAKYGLQQQTEATYSGYQSWASTDAGNGILTNSSTQITWNDPTDAHYLTNSLFQQAWVSHLTNAWGRASNGGVRWYLMDNEPSLWQATHRDVHPVGATMAEIRDKFFDYAEKVKAVDPTALVAGFEEWGWPAYFSSGYDQQHSGATDRATNGGMDYLPWLLQQAHQREVSTGKRLLDLFTVHAYPQGGEYSGSLDSGMQALRNRSTRQLWDTNYVDQSWINDRVMLIPRMKAWVSTNYPGLPIGITEYAWSINESDNHMNGATAQADLLGIFGREGLDLATRWVSPEATTATFRAMKMFRNYDGAKSGFGDTSVSAAGPDPDSVSVFAAARTNDSALTVMVINKQGITNAATTLQITNFIPRSPAQVWQLASTNAITRLADLAFTGNTLSNLLPAQSVTLFVIPAGTRPALRHIGLSTTNTYRFWLDGEVGQRYAILSSSNLSTWTPVLTTQLATASQALSMPLTNRTRLFRAAWVP